MLTKTFFAAGALLSLAAAVPMQKRDIVYTTEVHDVITTVDVTKTVWVTPGETAPAETSTASHFGHHSHKSKVTSAVQSTTTVPAAAPSSATEAASSISIAPVPSKVESTTEATSSTEAPAVYSTPSTTTSAAAAATSAASSGSSSGSNGLTGIAAAGKTYTGDLTWYQTGLGACGITSGSDDPIVAVSEVIFDTYGTANPNDNPLCNKKVTITGANGSAYTATIVDRCTGCAESDLDLSEGFFNTVTNYGNGRVPGVTWHFD